MTKLENQTRRYKRIFKDSTDLKIQGRKLSKKRLRKILRNESHFSQIEGLRTLNGNRHPLKHVIMTTQIPRGKENIPNFQQKGKTIVETSRMSRKVQVKRILFQTSPPRYWNPEDNRPKFQNTEGNDFQARVLPSVKQCEGRLYTF
jgi:hypothetical protein